MLVDELSKFGFDVKWIEKLKERGIKRLYKPQEEIVKKGLLDKNLIVSAPTASGKTLIALLKMIRALREKGKVVYLVPLVALGVEKYEEFKKFFDGSYSVALSVGDFDSTDPWLKDYDIVVATVEKFDSLLRHGVEWINQVKLVVVDEVHLLTDRSRGPTLEVLLTKLKSTLKHVDFLALSATINNVEELAEWLECEAYVSDFRPVKLYQGVAYDSVIHFLDKKDCKLREGDLIEEIVRDTLNLKKQVLVFVSTRKKAEALAEKLCKVVKNSLGKTTLKSLEVVARDVEGVLEVPTKQCERLAKCVRGGVAFHHAGLLGRQKRLIEENFKKGLIKVIVATTTLAAGINMPAFRVVIKDVKRYYPGLGAVYIPVLEYQQMIGRAGRPQYDKYGESIIVAKSENEAEELIERYIMGETEPIVSKLASEPALRSHVLALIASDFVSKETSLKRFFSRTFFAYQYGDIFLIEEKIDKILEELEEWKMVYRKNGRIKATRIGKRISELYLDPLSGWWFSKAVEKEISRPISYLQLISYAIEMRPLPSVGTSELIEIESVMAENRNNFLMDVPNEYEIEYEDFVKSLKMALMFQEWINEASEESLMEKYNITPGELHSRLQIADWLMYSFEEIARIKKKKLHANMARKLRVRLKYGVKEELLPLIRLEGIGRVKARKLFNAGIKSLKDLKKVPEESLSRLIGLKTAKKVKRALEGKKEEKQKTLIQI